METTPAKRAKTEEAAEAEAACGVCLDSRTAEYFTYKCGHEVCATCFLNNTCPTRPEADSNERNVMRMTGSRCPFCRDEVSTKLKDVIAERMAALIARPISEAEFRMSRTMDANRFFEAEISCSEDFFVSGLDALCTTATTAVRLMNILTCRYIKIISDIGNCDCDDELDNMMCPSLDEECVAGADVVRMMNIARARIRRLGSLIYKSGHVTPCFIYNLHKEDLPIGGAKTLAVVEATMAATKVNDGEVRAIRKALESIASTRRTAMAYHSRDSTVTLHAFRVPMGRNYINRS